VSGSFPVPVCTKKGDRAYSEKRMKKFIDALRDEDIQDLHAYFSTRDD
jgi:cytochrome c553